MSAFNTSNESEIRGIFEGVAAAQELVILATPYLRYESQFLGLEGDFLHARVTMGAEESMYGLRSPDLVMRFPEGARFLEGRTKLVGIGMLGGRRSLRLTLPKSLHDADHRRAYRVSRLPRVAATFSTPKFELRPASLVNLSTGGASIQVALAPGDTPMKEGDEVAISIPLTEEIRIDSRGIVRWVAGKNLGIEFKPIIQQPLLSPLSRWLFQRREEEKARLETVILPAIAGHPQAAHALLLVSGSEAVETQLKGLLPELGQIVRVSANVTSLKEALASGPALVAFHLASVGLDERRRLKTLVEMLAGKTPFVLLGTLPDSTPLFDLGTELKAAAVYDLGSKPGPFFARLIQGILRKQLSENNL